MLSFLRFLRSALRAVQLTLPKIGIGWMFALLTSNFNRITIYELGAVAVVVTTMVGLYHFLSPFQVVFGRMADRNPIGGFRRSPYLLGGLLISASVFPFLPRVAVGIGTGSMGLTLLGFALLLIFGLGFAMAGNAHLALIADVTTQRSRGIVVALVWTVQIASIIVSAAVMKQIMPVYDPELMQRLYNLTLPIVLIATVVALLGTERRLSADELAPALAEAARETPEGNILSATVSLLRSHRTTRDFFGFIVLSTLGVFLQDSILEVFGAELFGMSVRETTSFQQIWGGGVLLSMILVGAFTALKPVGKQRVAQVGNYATTFGLLLLAFTAFAQMRPLLNPALLVMGLGTGVYTVGALSTMMELSTSGAIATYMGLWGMAQAFGNGMSSIGAGALHTILIGSGAMGFNFGYGTIFLIEAGLMFGGALLLRRVTIAGFQAEVTGHDMVGAMEIGTA